MLKHNLEQQLRQTADAARHAPTQRLRTRTLAALRDVQHERAAALHRSTGWAMTMCAAMIVAVASFAFLQNGVRPEDSQVVVAPTSSPRLAIDFAVLPRIDAPLLKRSISAPYRNELRSLAIDAERALDQLRDHIPNLPRLDANSQHNDAFGGDEDSVLLR